jgi:hypothetical protein
LLVCLLIFLPCRAKKDLGSSRGRSLDHDEVLFIECAGGGDLLGRDTFSLEVMGVEAVMLTETVDEAVSLLDRAAKSDFRRASEDSIGRSWKWASDGRKRGPSVGRAPGSDGCS